jgi:hypothetical protein
MIRNDMEITTCIKMIISIDAWNFCASSIQWKFPIDTWKHFHGSHGSMDGSTPRYFSVLLKLIIMDCLNLLKFNLKIPPLEKSDIQ